MKNSVKYKNKVKIIETEEEKKVSKIKKKNINELFLYLDTRDFLSHPEIINEENDTIDYRYIEEIFMPKEEKDKSFLETVSLLHYKTTTRKNVSKKKYKDIYTKLIGNIDYIKEKYDNLINTIENEEYMSPGEYLFARNFNIIWQSITYAEKELNLWYRQVENETKQRVTIVHNNLKSDHFIIGKDEKGERNNYLISWDNYMVDTPVLDLYKLYQNELYNIDLIENFKEYSKIMKLNEIEIKLFNILISIPPNIELDNNEYNNVQKVRQLVKRIYKSNSLITADVFKIEQDNANN